MPSLTHYSSILVACRAHYKVYVTCIRYYSYLRVVYRKKYREITILEHWVLLYKNVYKAMAEGQQTRKCNNLLRTINIKNQYCVATCLQIPLLNVCHMEVWDILTLVLEINYTNYIIQGITKPKINSYRKNYSSGPNCFIGAANGA